MIRTITRAMNVEGTDPMPTPIIATMMAMTTTAIIKIEINDLSALGGVRSMRMLWEQGLDKADSGILRENR
jgi:hypothetical protein